MYYFRVIIQDAFLQSVELTSEAVEFLRGIFGLYDIDNVRFSLCHSFCDMVYAVRYLLMLSVMVL